MSKKPNRTLIGIFVVGAVFLFVFGIIIFSSTKFFRKTQKYVLFFDGSVRGLSVGAPVTFRGVKLGSVKEISLVYDHKTDFTFIPVIIETEASRIKNSPLRPDKASMQRLIDSGLRGRLETLSLITGQLAISLDFFPEKPARLRGLIKEYPEIPTIPSPLGELQKNIVDIPLKDISLNLQESVRSLNYALKESKDAVLYDLETTLREVKEAARAVRILAEYLEQHPEAILKGKQR